MMKVFDTKSLLQEKNRLKNKIQSHENELHSGLSGAEKSLEPFTRFFFPKSNGEALLGEENDWFHKGARMLIPFLVDRLTLGTRGLILNRGLSAALQFLAGRVSGQKLNDLFQNLVSKSLDNLPFRKRKAS